MRANHDRPWTIVWFAGWIEAAGGALLAAGLFTRAVAFVASGEMAAAYWIVHAPVSFYPVVNEGDLAVLFCFVFLLFVFRRPQRSEPRRSAEEANDESLTNFPTTSQSA
jgi:uncharacterized membrane protein YphA (DoxX/SURF4 family)